ncbi:glycogen synthase [bacterium]|nr:MAG: glycogen synthase [bacterium]
MAKELSVLFVTPEVYPFSNETSNADFSYSFTLALRELGHDARIMMPKFGNVSERKNRIHEINRLKDLSFDMGGEKIIGSIKSSSISNSRNKVQAYITTNIDYFDSFKGAYHDQKTWAAHPNNIERFIFFSKTVIDTCVLLNWYPQVIHCLSWQTALIPAYAKTLYPKEFKKTKFVFTSDNFLEQGVDKITKFNLLGLPESMKEDFSYNKQLNLLKGALIYSDKVTAIGKEFGAEVIKNDKLSDGLFKKVKDIKTKFAAFDSKVDTWTWNPSQDDNLVAKYEEDFVDFKYHNKVDLVNKFGMDFHPKTPLIAVNIKNDNKEDLKLFIDSSDILFKENLQVVLLGPGDKELKSKLEAIEKKHPTKFKFKLGYSESLNSEIEAGTDMYLILSQKPASSPKFMQACLYGSVPIAHNAGIIKELAEEFNDEEFEGNAFTFNEYTTESMMKAVKKALNLFSDKDDWITLARNCMLDDFTWKENIKEYDLFYKKLLKD